MWFAMPRLIMYGLKSHAERACSSLKYAMMGSALIQLLSKRLLDTMGSLVCMSEPSWSAAIFRSPVFQVQEPRCGFIFQRRLNMQGEQTSLRVVIADDHQMVRIG